MLIKKQKTRKGYPKINKDCKQIVKCYIRIKKGGKTNRIKSLINEKYASCPSQRLDFKGGRKRKDELRKKDNHRTRSSC